MIVCLFCPPAWTLQESKMAWHQKWSVTPCLLPMQQRLVYLWNHFFVSFQLQLLQKKIFWSISTLLIWVWSMIENQLFTIFTCSWEMAVQDHLPANCFTISNGLGVDMPVWRCYHDHQCLYVHFCRQARVGWLPPNSIRGRCKHFNYLTRVILISRHQAVVYPWKFNTKSSGKEFFVGYMPLLKPIRMPPYLAVVYLGYSIQNLQAKNVFDELHALVNANVCHPIWGCIWWEWRCQITCNMEYPRLGTW